VFLTIGSEKFMVGELLGFGLLVLGTLVYNEIIEIPIDFMSKNTKRNLELQEKQQAAKLEGDSDKSLSSQAYQNTDPETEGLLKN
jgi:hypothetical protein